MSDAASTTTSLHISIRKSPTTRWLRWRDYRPLISAWSSSRLRACRRTAMCCNIECGEPSNFWPVPKCHWQKLLMLRVSPIRAIASNLSGKLSASLPAAIGAFAFKTVSIQMAHSRSARRCNSSDLPPFPPRFILEIDIPKRLSGVIAHDKTRGLFLNAIRRREAAGGHG